MNPYLAKLHSLNFAKAAPRATDKTGKTTSEASCVGFVGVQGCLASKNDLCSTQPDGRAHSERLSTQSTDTASPLHDQLWDETEDKRAAIIECDGGAPRVWAEALARLDPACPPGDMPPKRWLRFIDDCGRFLDEGWATHAARLGWGRSTCSAATASNLSPVSTAPVCSGYSTAGNFSPLALTRLRSLPPVAAILPSDGAFLSQAACWRGSYNSMPRENRRPVWHASDVAWSGRP